LNLFPISEPEPDIQMVIANGYSKWL